MTCLEKGNYNKKVNLTCLKSFWPEINCDRKFCSEISRLKGWISQKVFIHLYENTFLGFV